MVLRVTAGLLALILSTTPSLGEECTLKQFGGTNRFAAAPASDKETLLRNIRTHEADLRTALKEAGWEGNADDLLAAMASATPKSFPVGQRFHWMLLRKKGAPTIVRDVCWGGDRPFPGWELTVESEGRRWRFAIPEACTNLALIGSEPLPSPPPEPAPKPPVMLSCQLVLSTTSVETGDELSIQVTPMPDRASQAELRIEREGQTVVEETLSPPFRWSGSFDEAGAYQVHVKISGEDVEDGECRGRFGVTSPPTARWIFRGFGAFADASFGNGWTRLDGTMHHGEHYGADNAWGLGFGAEFLPTPRIGIEGSFLWLRQEATLMADWGDLWEMGDDDLDWWTISLGANFRLAPPAAPVDLYAGPLVAFVNPGEADYYVLGEHRTIELDSEVTWGAQIGMDVPACSGGCPAFHAGVRYLDVSTEGSGFDVDVDPLTFMAGIALRF